MIQGQFLGLQEHAGSGSEKLAQLIALFDSGVEVVSYNGMIDSVEMSSDLMIAARARARFDQGETGGEFFEKLEIGDGILKRRVLLLSERKFASPRGSGWMPEDNGEVGLLNPMFVEGGAQHAHNLGLCGKKDDAAGGAIDSMEGMD